MWILRIEKLITAGSGGGIIKNQFDLYAIISREQEFEIS